MPQGIFELSNIEILNLSFGIIFIACMDLSKFVKFPLGKPMLYGFYLYQAKV